MASEIVHDADAALTSILQLSMEQEARAGLVAPMFYREVMIAGPTLAYKISKHPVTANAGAITDGTAMSNTGINPTSVSITAAGIGLKGVLTKFSVEGSLLNYQETIANFGRSLVNKMDVDGCGLLQSFSTVVGTSAADLTVGNFLTAIYQLEEANEAAGLVSVLDPLQVHDIRSAIVASSAPIWSGGEGGPLSGFLSSGVANGAFKGSLFNVPIYASSNVVDDTTNKLGGMFARGRALTWAWKWYPQVESIQAPEYPGVTFSAHAAYGVGEVHDLAGVTLRSGNT